MWGRGGEGGGCVEGYVCTELQSVGVRQLGGIIPPAMCLMLNAIIDRFLEKIMSLQDDKLMILK